MAELYPTRSVVCATCHVEFEYKIASGRPRLHCKREECAKSRLQARHLAKYKKRERKKPGFVISCEFCSKAFASNIRKKRFCSASCANKSRIIIPEATCGHCKKVFAPKQAANHSFCSRDCAFSFEKIHGRIWKAGWQQRQEAKARTAEAALRRTTTCIVCAKPFPYLGTAKCCSDECRRQKARSESLVYSKAYDKRDRSERPCKECAAVFAPEYGNRKRVFCSRKCRIVNGQRVAKSVRRARQFGAVHESVDPREICERDGWRCHLCKCFTPKRLRGSTHKRAPEVDHIVPLAAGGSHTRDNLACCCRGCNQAKGAMPLGQLRLRLKVLAAS